MNQNEKALKIAEHYQAILELIGEDTSREGLQKTPLRAAKALLHATSGYQKEGVDVVGDAIFDSPGGGLIVVKDIEFYSLCEHHILPFYGHISVGYVPNGKIIGISKLARLAEMFARRLQVQERLTWDICHELYRTLNCKGVIVKCEAHHMCMKMRGVEKQDSTTYTIATDGILTTDTALRQEFFEAIRK